MMSPFTLVALPILVALSGPWPLSGPLADVRPPVSQVKLGFTYMNEVQAKELWKRADAYALAEAFLKRCGAPSFVERRMRIAADPCIEKQALDRVAVYFRNKVAHFGRTKNFVCDTLEARQLVTTVRQRIDKDVEEVRTMCQNCFFC